jgi:signal transduction histidine kinase
MGDLRLDVPDVPLAEAVRRHAATWSRLAGVDVRVRATDGAGRDLGDEDRHEVLSILKEALRNVERHARAESVRIELDHSGERLALTIADDGVGFAPPAGAALALRGHYGLIGMGERAERLGGELEVRALPAGGTTISLLVPRESEKEANETRPALRGLEEVTA